MELVCLVECNTVPQQELTIAVVELWACNTIYEIRSDKRKVPSQSSV